MRMATQKTMPSEDWKWCSNATMTVSWSTTALSPFDWSITRKIHFRTTSSSLLRPQLQKEIIIGHPASVRLGLIQVLCKNHAKTVSSIEVDQTNNLFRVHNIDGKTLHDQNGAVLSQREIDGEDHPSPPEVRMSTDRPIESPKHQTEHLYGMNNHIQSNSSSFQDQNPWGEEKQQIKLISRPYDPEHDETSQRTQPKVLFAN